MNTLPHLVSTDRPDRTIAVHLPGFTEDSLESLVTHPVTASTSDAVGCIWWRRASGGEINCRLLALRVFVDGLQVPTWLKGDTLFTHVTGQTPDTVRVGVQVAGNTHDLGSVALGGFLQTVDWTGSPRSQGSLVGNGYWQRTRWVADSSENWLWDLRTGAPAIRLNTADLTPGITGDRNLLVDSTVWELAPHPTPTRSSHCQNRGSSVELGPTCWHTDSIMCDATGACITHPGANLTASGTGLVTPRRSADYVLYRLYRGSTELDGHPVIDSAGIRYIIAEDYAWADFSNDGSLFWGIKALDRITRVTEPGGDTTTYYYYKLHKRQSTNGELIQSIEWRLDFQIREQGNELLVAFDQDHLGVSGAVTTGSILYHNVGALYSLESQQWVARLNFPVWARGYPALVGDTLIVAYGSLNHIGHILLRPVEILPPR